MQQILLKTSKKLLDCKQNSFSGTFTMSNLNAIFLKFPCGNLFGNVPANSQNQLRFVYTHFKSCGQSLDKTSSDFSDIFHAMQSCAMNAKSSIIPKLPMGMVIRLEMGKTNLSRLGLYLLDLEMSL